MAFFDLRFTKDDRGDTILDGMVGTAKEDCSRAPVGAVQGP